MKDAETVIKVMHSYENVMKEVETEKLYLYIFAFDILNWANIFILYIFASRKSTVVM